MSRRHRQRTSTIGILLGLVLLVVAAVLVWWWSTHERAVPQITSVPSDVAATAAPDPAGEDFRADERQTLEEVLRRKGAGKQP